MPTFKNLNQLDSWIQKNAMNIVLSNGKTLRTILDEEAEKLRKILLKYISAYYDSYTPTVYERTMGLLNSLRVDAVKKDGNNISVRLWFDDNAVHPSVFGDDQDDGFVAILIDTGWQVSRGWHKDISHFGFQEGAHFVKNSVDEYNANNQYGFRISVEYSPYSDLNFEV